MRWSVLLLNSALQTINPSALIFGLRLSMSAKFAPTVSGSCLSSSGIGEKTLSDYFV
jgi:hypothetical protein